MAVCAVCGTDNRDKARYCRGCARPLAPLGHEDEAVATATADRPKRARRSQRSSPSEATSTAFAQKRYGVALGAVALVVGLVGWLVWPDPSGSTPPAAADAPALAVPLNDSPPAGPAATATPVSPLVLPSDAGTRSTPASVAAATTSGLTAEPPAVRPRPATDQRAAGTAPRTRSQPRPTATDKPAPAAEPATPAPSAAAAVPTAPVRSASVDERCADRGNFLTRDLCRIQACGNPALAGDPVCVRFREMEAANRDRVGN